MSLELEGAAIPTTFLLDTGAVANRLPIDWAPLIGIDLTDRPEEFIGLGGMPDVKCYLVEDLQAVLGDISLTLNMWFCDGWDSPFGLLGQEGFLQYFTLTMSASEGWFDLDPLS